MNSFDSQSPEPGQLRQRAEQRLQGTPPQDLKALSKDDLCVLVRELQVHQIELELQQEELLRGQAAAHAEKERLAALINGIEDEVWFADEQKRFTLANASALQEFGVESGDTVAVEPFAAKLEVRRQDGTLRPVEDAPPLRALRGEVVRNEEEIVRTPTRQELRYRQVSASPVRNGQGHIIGSVSVVRDITQFKRTETALRESEERLRLALEAASAGIWEWDPYTLATQWSKECWRLYGLTPHGAAASYQTWINAIHPDDREMSERVVHEAVRRGGELSLEFRIVEPSGAVRWLMARGRPTPDPAGKPGRFLGIVMDISLRKRTEEQLRELSQRLTYHVENSPLAVIEWGPDMRLTRWAGEAEHMFGWKAVEVLGKRMEDLRWIHAEDAALVTEVSAGLQSGATPRRFSANRNYRKDGSIAYCEWYNSALMDDAGRLRSILSLVQDVTERKLAEEEIRLQMEEMRANGEELVRFNEAAVGRELQMIELKRQVNELCVQTGQPPRYRLDFDTEDP